MALSKTSFNLRTKIIVTEEQSTKPYVGFEHLETKPDGWLWDVKRWGSPFDIKLPTLPRLLDVSTQGVNESVYFRPGVGSVSLKDLLIYRIWDTFYQDFNMWVPIVKAGNYFRYKTPFYYYSDNSRVQHIDPTENRDGRNYIELDATPKFDNSILAASFSRDPDTKAITYKHKFNQCYKFTGLYSDGEELETVSDAGKITWENVDTTKKEFIVDQTIDGLTRLFFNRSYTTQVGVVVSDYEDLASCEFLGVSTGQGHELLYDEETTLYTQTYPCSSFPILNNGSFHMYVSDNSSYSEWTRVDSWWDMINSSNERLYYVDFDLGYVCVGSNDPTHLPAAGRNISVTYQNTLRIEYEEEDTIDEIQAVNANVNPITQSLNQGFVCITHENLEAAKISLRINKSKILNTSPREYGPIVIGSDYAILTATVTNITDLPLAQIPVTFTMTPIGVGSINGSFEAFGITNSRGEAYANYQPPVSAEELGYYSTIVRDSTSPYYPAPTYKELVISVYQPGLQNQEENLYLYQILKDDIILGYKTVEDYLLSLYQEDTPNWVVDATTYAEWKQEMILKYDLKDFTEPTAQNKPIAGRKVITYQISGVDNEDPYAIHPVTGELGAVVPVRPDVIEQIQGLGDGTDGLWRVIYPAGALPDCGPAEDVGGYWAVASKTVTFQAHCWSPYYNREIYSNKITARITLPPYMLGEYINSLGQKVPFGWKLPTDTDDVAAGLDGATFITVNPFSGPYAIIDLVNGEDSDEWADAPFRTIGFQFYIEES